MATKNSAPIVITGARGFIGEALIEQLVKHHPIVGLDLDDDEVRKNGRIRFIKCDLTNPDSIADALAQTAERYGKTIAAVIHLAAYFDFSGEAHPLYKKLNVEGTGLLLKALQKYKVERFIYASTMLVHAPAKPGLPINEQSPLQPKWAYPVSKLEAEREIEKEHGDIPVAILRLAGVYTMQCKSPTLAHQIQRIYENTLTSRVYAGDPEVGQSALHIEDMAAAFQATVKKRKQLPDYYIALIGEAHVMTYAALQRAVGEHLYHHPHPTVEVPKPIAKAGAWLQDKTETIVPDSIDEGVKPFIRPFMIDLAEDHFELDISHAELTLGWRPQHDLRDELPAMVGELQRDPPHWYDCNGLHQPAWLRQMAAASDKPEAIQQQKAGLEKEHAQEHHNWLWAHGVCAGLGAWLMVSPATMGYAGTPAGINELITGAAILIFSLLSLNPQWSLARWANGAAGLWLAFAPLAFWSDSAAAYLNATLVGLAVTALAMLAKPNVGLGEAAHYQPRAVPPGWDYCPSSWSQRLPIVVLAVVGLLISRYLAAYQLEHIPQAWDPFFGDGTETIITSRISEAWPVPDAGLGGFVYLLEILAGLIGSKYRWHQMPWLTLLFGFLIVPLGAVSIYFIIIQPVVIGTWCTLCLIAAAAMLLQIPYSVDEILATLQFLVRRQKAGRFWLVVLFRGDMDPTPAPQAAPAPAPQLQPGIAANVWNELFRSGVTPTWSLCMSILIGVILMFSRVLFGTEPGLAHTDHLLGALVITVSVASFAEAARSLRWVNAVLGTALIGAPFILNGGTLLGESANILAGLLLIALSAPRGKIQHAMGSWNAYIV